MRLFQCFLFLCFTGSVVAQNDPKPTREIHVRLLAFDSTSIPQDCFAFDPGAPNGTPDVSAPIKGYLNHEDLVLKLFGNEVRFLKSSKPEDLETAGNELAKVRLPKSGNRFIFMFLPAGGGKFRIFPFDDSIKGFPRGSYLVFNLSRSPVKLALEKKSYTFKPGESSVITDPPVQANNHSAMYAFTQADGKWQRIGSGLWPHPGTKRSIQIFFDNPESQQTELRGFRDISPPDPDSENPQNP